MASGKKSKWVVVTVLSVTLVAVAVLYFLGWFDGEPNYRATVACARQNAGIECMVKHTEGAVPLNVCWDVTMRCRNGAEILGGGCQTVQPGATARNLIPAEELVDHDQCDAVAKSAISNVRVLEDVSE